MNTQRRLYTLFWVFSFLLMTTNLMAAKSTPSKSVPSYEEQWKKVTGFVEADRPTSALEVVALIEQRANKEKNTIQQIKARVISLQLNLQKDPDQLPAQLAGMEALTAETQDVASKALLQSMTAEVYLIYYQRNAYKINQRTDIVGQIVNDPSQWTKKIVTDTICSLLALSLQPAELLQATPITAYKELLTVGNTTNLEPTLFDMLSRRRVALLKSLRSTQNDYQFNSDLVPLLCPVPQFVALQCDATGLSMVEVSMIRTLQDWLRFRLKAGRPDALINADLYRLKTLYALADRPQRWGSNIVPQTPTEQAYLSALQTLSSQNANNPHSLTVQEAEATFYRSLHRETDSLFRHYLKKAYTVCAEGLARHPNAPFSNHLRNLQADITQQRINITQNKVVRSDSALTLNITAYNIDKAVLTIYRVNLSPQDYYEKTRRNPSPDTLRSVTLLEKRVVTLNTDSLFNAANTLINLKGRSYGQYAFRLQSLKDPSVAVNGYYVVSDLACITQSNTQHVLYVVDRITGKPQPGVKVTIHPTTYRKRFEVEPRTAQGYTDENGYLAYNTQDKEYNHVLFFESGNDRYLCSEYNGHTYKSDDVDVREDRHLTLLTDRSLYRPGQTVYVKGIAYQMNNKGVERVLPNKMYEVELWAANRQVISKQPFRTNEFGSFSGSFVLPEDGLNGLYYLRSEDAMFRIRVEAYKRPSFEVTLNKPETTVRFGEAVQINGRVNAYAGYGIAGAEVSYQVIRRPHHRWWWMNRGEEPIAHGITNTETDGSFTISFIPERLKNTTGDQFYTYTIQTTVTDQKGETREGEQTLSVGDKSLFVLTDLVDRSVLNKTKSRPIKVYVETLNGIRRQAEVNYELCLLDDPEVFIDAQENSERYLLLEPQRKPGKLIRSGRLHTKDSPLVLDFSTIPSGVYQLVCTTTDDRGQTVTNFNEFTVFAPDDKQTPVKAYVWMHASDTEFATDDPAVIHIGTAARDVYMLYQVVRGRKVLESRWMNVSDALQTLTIPYKESYEDGVYVKITVVKNEQMFTEQVLLKRTIQEKKLTPKLAVFRNKLRPGETAEWTLSIPEVKEKQQPAEVLASMYDASLDAIQPHHFYFNPRYSPRYPYPSDWRVLTFNRDYANGQANLRRKKEHVQLFADIDWMVGVSEMQAGRGSALRIRGTASLKFNAPEFEGINVTSIDEALQGRVAGLSIAVRGSDEARGVDIADLEEHAVVVEEKAELRSQEELTGATSKPVVTPRRQFNETAFFYPHLRTDEAGNVVFSFTVPESLTRWNLNLVAHTKDLYSGSLETQVETQKELMVQLNRPRFVRRSDKPVLSAAVVNMSDSALTAEVTLELLNPADEKPLAAGLIKQPSQTVQLAAGETKALSWALEPLSTFDLVVCKVVATTALFSDGEQDYLPVLPDKALITESLPLTVKVNQTKVYTLDRLLKPAKGTTPHALTVEFSPNPTWMALMALPTMAEPTHDNAIDFFTACYVSRLATHIVHSYPKLSAVFDQWRQTGNSLTTLLSSLSKNQQVKTLLLEETPWVMAAKDETEQRRQLALLFDLNQQKNQQRRFWDKLIALQQPSGGFAWFKGMPESRYVTQYILLNEARLNAMVKQQSQSGATTQAGYSQDIVIGLPDPAILKALAYADKAIAEDYEALKKQRGVKLEAYHIGNIQWQYLHLRSCYPQVAIPQASEEAVAYYTKQAELYWRSATLYGKAATALIAARRGNTTLATDILTGLKEQALTSEELGMYWAHNKPGFFWYERPIGVQTMMLEAFAEVAPVTDDLDAMKTWLLRQKQTQRWDTKLSTVDAINALLTQGSDWFGSDNTVSLKLGNVEVPTDKAAVGTGYVQHTYEADAIKPSMGKVTVGLKGKAGMGWGALYWQYFQDIDQVTAAGTNLSVSKQLFLEQTTPNGKVMVPLDGKNLKPGDKVITRLFVTVDRDMDFVVLKDQRAACFEPVEQRSGYVWREGVGYYQTAKDASTQFFFNHLPKGRYAFEYAVFVNNAGSFADGVATVQCLYAPEFTAHSSGGRLEVKP